MIYIPGTNSNVCERCGNDFDRPTVGGVCRKCVIQDWVVHSVPPSSLGEELQRHDFESAEGEGYDIEIDPGDPWIEPDRTAEPPVAVQLREAKLREAKLRSAIEAATDEILYGANPYRARTLLASIWAELGGKGRLFAHVGRVPAGQPRSRHHHAPGCGRYGYCDCGCEAIDRDADDH